MLTVTLNAALDVTYHARRFTWGDQNRVEAVHRRAGGKGVNVARVLEQLGVGALVTGFAGGPTGQAIRRSLPASGFQERLLEITGESRTTVVTVSESDGLVSTFDEPGPTVSSSEWERFLVHFDELVRGRQVVALSGSLSQGLPEDAYRRLAEIAARHGVPAILDSSGRALTAGLGGRPAVVKPNLKELLEASGAEETRGDVLAAARELQRRGAEAVVVSMGKEGEEARRQAELGPYWVNQDLVKLAKPDTMVMHCLPVPFRGHSPQAFLAHRDHDGLRPAALELPGRCEDIAPSLFGA